VAVQGKRILVVDDAPAVRRSLRKILEGRGHQVVEAADGEQALARMVLFGPDLVVLDVMMPGKSGLQVSAAIKCRPEYRRLPIVLLSGGARGTEEELKARSFADAFVAKPCKARDLLEVIDRLLGDRA